MKNSKYLKKRSPTCAKQAKNEPHSKIQNIRSSNMSWKMKKSKIQNIRYYMTAYLKNEKIKNDTVSTLHATRYAIEKPNMTQYRHYTTETWALKQSYGLDLLLYDIDHMQKTRTCVFNIATYCIWCLSDVIHIYSIVLTVC